MVVICYLASTFFVYIHLYSHISVHYGVVIFWASVLGTLNRTTDVEAPPARRSKVPGYSDRIRRPAALASLLQDGLLNLVMPH